MASFAAARQLLFKKVPWAPIVGLGSGMMLGSVMLTGSALLDDSLQPPKYPWSHNGSFETYDSASMRRGFEVYRQVCSTCHSLKYIHYRDLVGNTHTEEQAKALAESIEVKDGPNDNGEMFDRPGKLFDTLPSPYENDNAGRAANNGSLPPDLSLIIKARPNGADYVYSLMTGYHDAPAGVVLRSGLAYNPYFPGGAIGMPKPLVDGQVEYEDGTEATVSQMAKDVTTFLCWAAEPEHDTRKKQGCQALIGMIACACAFGYWKRFKWSVIKTQRTTYTNSVRKM